jgi:hypothetical protein
MSPPPVCLEREELVAAARTQEWVNKACRGQVSVKLTPESCTNNASSNSRLTAAGRQDTATDTILRTVSRLFFFSLPTFDEKTTKLHLHAEKLTETVLHLNLGHFVGFFWVFLFCAVLFYFILPLWWDNYRTTSEAPSPGLESEGWTSKLLRLKLHCIWTWRFFYIFFFFHLLIFFIFILVFILFIFYFQSFLCLSNAFSAYIWLVHCLSLFISLKLFLFVLFCFSTCLFVFPFSFNFFAFHPLSPFHSKYH